MRTTAAVAILAAALAGPALAKPEGGDILPASGPLTRTAMARLLLTDATRVGNRVVAVGDRGYIVFSDDNGTSWKRACAIGWFRASCEPRSMPCGLLRDASCTSHRMLRRRATPTIWRRL